MDDRNNYQILYFTTPFCGVCQSAKKVIEILALSLEVEMEEINVNHFSNKIENVVVSQTPSVGIVFKNKTIVYYTENINNVADLYQRFDTAINHFINACKIDNL